MFLSNNSVNTKLLVWILIVSLQIVIILGIYNNQSLKGVYSEDSKIPQQYLDISGNSSVYTMEPNLSVVLETTGSEKKKYLVETNSEGIRDSQISSYTGNEDQKLVAVVGDSMTFGWGINKTNRLTERCERDLRNNGRDIGVINYGVPGYGMKNYADLIERKVKDIEPDMVAIVFSEEDSFSTENYRGSFYENENRMASNKIRDIEKNNISELGLSNQMNRISNQDDIRNIPKVFVSYWPFNNEDRKFLRNWAELRDNTSFVDAESSFNERPMENFILSENDPHLNNEGHEALGKTLCEQINHNLIR